MAGHHPTLGLHTGHGLRCVRTTRKAFCGRFENFDLVCNEDNSKFGCNLTNPSIWISPVTKQIDDFTVYGEAYHGYWQQDIYSLNPHFGNASDLLALSQALHARGMALMVDVVVNHYGSPAQIDYSSYIPFNDGSYFHAEEFITNYNNQTLVEQGWLGNSEVPLPDVNTENPTVVSTFNAWISELVQTYQIDGLRLDTVKHVRQDFWPGFVNASGVFALGEVLSGDPNYLSAYQPYTGGLLDYATYYPLLRAFLPGGNMNEIASLTAPSYRALFTDTQLLGCFMENHDNPRFPNSTSSDPTIVMNAMAYVLLSDGIPIIYYGQEQSFDGGQDPANREYMWKSGYQITSLYSYLATLNRARSLAWSAGFGTNLTSTMYLDSNVMVSQKGPLLMVLSNGGSGAAIKTISVPTQFAASTVLVDVLSCNAVSIGKASTNITITSGVPQIYLSLGLAKQMCTNIVMPSSAPTSIMSRITSMFTSSSKAATRSATRSSQSTYNSGISATVTTSLGIIKPTVTSNEPPLLPTSKSSTTAVAAGRVPITPSPASTTTVQKGTSSIVPSPVPTTSSVQNGRVAISPVTAHSSTTSRQALVPSTSSVHTSQSASPTTPSASSMTPSTTSSSKASRVPIVPLSPTEAKQKRQLLEPGRLNDANRNLRPSSPSSTLPGRKQQAVRQPSAPPASSSQHYRGERVVSSGAPGLSSTYSYSSSHLPPPISALNETSRSNSETNLYRRHESGAHVPGHAQSRSVHSLRRKGSATSLRVSSFRGDIEPAPPIPRRLDSRTALYEDSAPYAHTKNLSSTTLALPNPRSRRSSITSTRSAFVGAGPKRNPSQERLHLLAQGNGASTPYIKPGFVDPHSMQLRAQQIMGDSSFSNSRTTLEQHPDKRHMHRSPTSLPNIRPRQDTRQQLHQDIRQYPI